MCVWLRSFSIAFSALEPQIGNHSFVFLALILELRSFSWGTLVWDPQLWNLSCQALPFELSFVYSDGPLELWLFVFGSQAVAIWDSSIPGSTLSRFGGTLPGGPHHPTIELYTK